MENIDKLCKLLESYQKEYIKYVLDRKEFCESQEIENQDDAKRALLKFGFLDGEFESTAREAGHLCGIQEAITFWIQEAEAEKPEDKKKRALVNLANTCGLAPKQTQEILAIINRGK